MRTSISGWRRPRTEDDTLVISTVSLGDKTWFDQAGSFHSDAESHGTLHPDRYDAHQLQATLDD
jgi:hypothetical protein